MPDFEIADHGSICLLTPMTEAAHDWVEQNLPEDRMTWGQCSIVVEPRCLPPIIHGIKDEGLTIQ